MTTRTVVPPRVGHRLGIRSLVTAGLLGLVLGVLSMYAQGWLPGHWNSLANSGAVWAFGAFVAGAVVFRHGWPTAAVAGALVELGLVVGYYTSVAIRYDQGGPEYFAYLWAVVALLAGPIFGVAGMWWRGTARTWHVAGIALLGALFVGEGAVRLITLDGDGPFAWPMIAVGLLTPLALGRDVRNKVYGLLGTLPAVALALLGFAALKLFT